MGDSGCQIGHLEGSPSQSLRAERHIDIRIRSLAQLFDPLDPSPISSRSLAAGVVDYIVERAGGAADKGQLALLIHGPDSLVEHEADIARAVAAHFRASHAKGEKQFVRRLRVGGTTLIVGLAVLAVAIVLRTLIRGASNGALAQGLGEGLLILGWVAMWRPVEILLFEHWESHLDHAVLDRLARIRVTVSTPA